MGGLTADQADQRAMRTQTPTARASDGLAQEGGMPDGRSTGPDVSHMDSNHSRNPYSPGVPVTTPAMFFGREAECELVVNRLAGGVHTAVVGPGEIGVSSLLRRLALRPADSSPLVAFADLTDITVQTSDGLARSLWSQWWSQIRPGYVPEIDGRAALDPLARRLSREGHRLVAVLDAYEQLLWRPGSFDAAFHSRLEALAHEGIIILVTGTHTPVAELHQQAENKSRLYEQLVQLDLGLLTADSATALLATPISRAGLAVAESEVQYFVELVGAHPLFLHLAGIYLFAALDSNRYDRAHVAAQFKAAAGPYWEEMWLALPPPAQASLTLKSSPKGLDMRNRQIRALERKGIVVGHGRDARLFSQGFAEWSRRMQRASQLAREATTAGRSVLDSEQWP